MSKSQLFARRSLGSILSAAVLLVAACKSNNVTSPAVVAAGIAPYNAGIVPVGTVGLALAQPVAVLVTDGNGNPLPSATVTWTIFGGGGALSLTTDTSYAATQTAVTNSLGLAYITWQLGTVAGVDSLTASVGGGIAATLTATAQAGAVASLSVMQGAAQTVAMDSTTQPIVVEAMDQYGNPVAGVSIAWVDPNGGTLSAMTGITNASGQVSVQLTTAPGIPAYTVIAEVSAQPAIEVTVTVIAQ
jgi:hypothetical protein